MKKNLFFVAVAALALTACSSDNEATQSAPQLQSGPQAVAFDTYMPQVAKVTRAGSPEGVMTTDKLKKPGKGFGVFAYYADEGAAYASTLKPNFMYNEQVHWTGGWTYSPLKYWPNETKNDSQDPAATIPSSRLDKLSFFAYAPYVSTGSTGTLNNAHTDYKSTVDFWDTSTPQTYGIMAIKKESETGDPLVEWKYSSDVDHNVDLLWGVAPKGMDYTAVNGENVPTTFGKPLVNLVKPDKDMKVKFLFQHALTRIGLTVVSAIDQIAAGDDGGKFNKNHTRVLIEDVAIAGTFGTQGVLNLNNPTENVANWDYTNATWDAGTSDLFTFDNGLVGSTNRLVSKDLRYADLSTVDTEDEFLALNEGVLPSEKMLIQGDADPDKVVNNGANSTPAYQFGKAYYYNDGQDYVIATVAATNQGAGDVATYTKDVAGNYTQVKKTNSTVQQLDGLTKYYIISVSAKKTSTGTDKIADGAVYYTRTGSADGKYVYIYHKNETGVAIDDSELDYYEISGETQLTSTGNYASQIYYTGLMPRYMMFLPSKPGTPTSVTVRIKYHVVTFDEKLEGAKSDVTNEVTKTATFDFESGKSYNLKLILGLTTVKLDATVGEWQVGDDAEVWLPKNVE